MEPKQPLPKWMLKDMKESEMIAIDERVPRVARAYGCHASSSTIIYSST